MIVTACGVRNSCEVKSSDPPKGISGEFRSGVAQSWDFRSDGTYTKHHTLSLMGKDTVFNATGTYKIVGKKVVATETSITVNDKKKQTNSTETLSLEDNGDLITQRGVRLKKQ